MCSGEIPRSVQFTASNHRCFKEGHENNKSISCLYGWARTWREGEAIKLLLYIFQYCTAKKMVKKWRFSLPSCGSENKRMELPTLIVCVFRHIYLSLRCDIDCAIVSPWDFFQSLMIDSILTKSESWILVLSTWFAFWRFLIDYARVWAYFSICTIEDTKRKVYGSFMLVI